MLFALLVIVQSIAGSSEQSLSLEERPIIEAVLRDPRLVWETDGGRFDLGGDTRLSGLHPWVEPRLSETRIQIDGTMDTFVLPAELIASAKTRNARSISVRRFTRPARTARNKDRSFRYSRRVSVSRPGISSGAASKTRAPRARWYRDSR